MLGSPKSWRTLSLPLGGLVWLLAAGFGGAELQRYSLTPGDAGRSPDQWPTESALRQVSGVPTLVTITHPRCPCSRASLYELGRAVGRLPGRVTTYVLFVVPPGAGPDWLETDLWRAASALPGGVTVVRDSGGEEARRFGAATSGQTVLYAPDGRLLFSGGITGARGHVGDNLGSASVVSLVREGHAERERTPVYGCPLFDSESRCLEGGLSCPKHAS